MPPGSATRNCASARVKRDERLAPHIERVWRANFQAYGATKVWKQMHREGVRVA